MSVGAGPANLTFHVDLKYPGSRYSEQRKLAEDIVPIFNQDLKDLVARGAEFIQIEDLGGWQLAWDPNSKWIIDILNAWIDGVDAKIAWHSCLGAGYGNTFRSVEDALPRVLERWQDVKVQQFALDFALRNMVDVHALKELEPDREVQAGVIDIRSLYIETDDEIVRRIHKVLEYIEPERVYLSTDCGLKALPRFVALEKLKALVRAANRVRAELPAPRVAARHGRGEVSPALQWPQGGLAGPSWPQGGSAGPSWPQGDLAVRFGPRALGIFVRGHLGPAWNRSPHGRAHGGTVPRDGGSPANKASGKPLLRAFSSCASRGLDALHSAVQPPSTTSELPVIKALASLAKNKIGPVKS